MKKLELIEDAIAGWYGPRCSTYEKLCVVCAAWKAYDLVKKTLDKRENSR